MTFELLNKIIAENNIPSDVKLLSDSGWECGDTEMDGVYYDKKSNIIVFTQRKEYEYENDKDFVLLYNGEEV